MIRIPWVRLDNSNDYTRGNETSNVVHMTISVISLKTIMEPYHFLDSKPSLQARLNFFSIKGWIPVGI
jgi:hypothetical protein